ncbi:hypothetical protein Tco_0174594 [Tanacetum coccineum]
MPTSREALWECQQIEEMHNSWKERKWRQRAKKMSRIREQHVVISGTLSPGCRKKLEDIIQAHANVFAWAIAAATAVPRLVMEHQLKVRMDYSSLNKVYTKDLYPFPEVDETLALPAGCRNVEVYLEEIVVKSISEKSLLLDVQETLDKLQRVNMKIDPNRCTFGMEEGKFLGYVIIKEGIKADPEKVQVILRSSTPGSPYQVRSLSLRLASIDRFIPKLAELMSPIRRAQRSWKTAEGSG